LAPNQKSQGSPAFKKLLDADPAKRTDFLENQIRYKARLDKLKREIESIEGVNHELRHLKNAGASSDKVLHIIAIEVTWGSWMREIRMAKDRVKKAAKYLRQHADELEQLYSDPATYPDMWLVHLQEIRQGSITPVAERIPISLLAEMRSRANELLGLSIEFADVLKHYAPIQRRKRIETLLAYVHKATGGIRRHLPSLAALLTEVYEQYDLDRKATPDGLAKIFERHVKFHRQSPPPK
jgi:hypothetical protein